MNEWSVIVMLITLGGGIIALVRPIVTLTKAITELTVTCNFRKKPVTNQRRNRDTGCIVWIFHCGRTGCMVEEQQLHSSRAESGRNDEGNARI